MTTVRPCRLLLVRLAAVCSTYRTTRSHHVTRRRLRQTSHFTRTPRFRRGGTWATRQRVRCVSVPSNRRRCMTTVSTSRPSTLNTTSSAASTTSRSRPAAHFTFDGIAITPSDRTTVHFSLFCSLMREFNVARLLITCRCREGLLLQHDYIMSGKSWNFNDCLILLFAGRPKSLLNGDENVYPGCDNKFQCV